MPDVDRWRTVADEAARRDQQLRRAMEIARIGTWEWVVEENRVYWSEELYRIYGLRIDEFAGTLEGFVARLHPEDRERSLAAVRQAMQNGEPFDFRERILRPDGSVRVLHSQGEVVRDGDGRPLRLFGVCQDITEQVEAEERIRRAGAAAETARVLHGLAALTPALESARSLAEQLLSAGGDEAAARRRELAERLAVAEAALAQLTGAGGAASRPDAR